VVDKGTLRQYAVIIHVPVLDVGKEDIYKQYVKDSWLKKQKNHEKIDHHKLKTWRRNRQTVTMAMMTLHYGQCLEMTKKGTMFVCELIASICRWNWTQGQQYQLCQSKSGISYFQR